MAYRANPILVKLRAAGVLPKRAPGLRGKRTVRWSGEELAAIKAAVERDDLTNVEIAAQFKTSRGMVACLIKLHGWVRPVNGCVINGRRLAAHPKQEEWHKIPRTGRPKGIKMSAETCAKHSASMRRRWAGPEREKLLAMASRGRAKVVEMYPDFNRKTRPAPGTPERRLFEKIADALGAAAAHAEFTQASK